MSVNEQGHSVDASNAAALTSLYKQRSSAKGNITRIRKLLEDKAASLNPIDLECRLEIVNSYIKQLMAYQTEIEKLSPEDNKRGELEEVCISTKSLLLSKLGSGRRNSVGHDYTMSVPLPPTHRLPHLKIPKFNGKYSEYKNFIACFNNLVNDDPSLSVIEKFNHLIASLQDDALRTVKAFQVNEQNYSCALKRLAERYDNNCLIFQDHISSLFNLQKMTKPCASELRQIVDTVSAVLDSLSHLGTDKEITHAIIIHLVLSKLDTVSKSKWDEQLTYTTLPKWSDCAAILIRRCQFLEINGDKSSKESYSSRHDKCRTNEKFKKGSQYSFTCVDKQIEECVFCAGKDHKIMACPMFSNLHVSQRFEYTKQKGLCINCLKIGHSVKKCRASRCSICQRPHHSLLHNDELIRKNESNLANSNNPSLWPVNNAAISNGSAQCIESASSSRNEAQRRGNQFNGIDNHSATSMCAHKSEHGVLLATAMVKIKGKSGQYYAVRALLDSGSQVNFVTEEIGQLLSLKRDRACLDIVGIGNSSRKVKQRLSTFIKSHSSSFEFMADFYIMKSIASPQPPEQIEKNKLGIPNNIVLADPNFHKPSKIDVLIGAESFFELLSVGQIKLGPQLPTLQKTLLGWIISGKCESGWKYKSNLCHITTHSNEDYNTVNLDDMVQKFWELEQVPNCNKMTDEHLMCESHFESTTKRVDDGRFEVRLPFKTDPKVLGASFDTAKRRFLSLERRLSKNPELRKMYVDFMREYVALGHMSPTENVIPSVPHYFIPHQCVLRAQSTTTKLRVVFDASCKTSTHISLNDILMVGPTIQNDLFSTLLRFRLHKYALTADVTKMYRQVKVHKDDRKFQLILWRASPNLPLQIYELNTVTYGTASAPFLAIRCLKEISKIFQDVYPLGSNVIANDFYVDDLLTGADDVKTLLQIRDEVVRILSSCGFFLAKWHTNFLDHSNVELVRNLDFHDSDITRALGIQWKPQEDTLCFQLENDFETKPATKRNILSVSSRLFDPIGLLAALIISAKILLQDLWENNLDWDESIPQKMHTSWTTFKTTLENINQITTTRFVGTTLNASVQIHGFADASMRAYGCCIYVVSDQTEGITSQLLVAKSKVAPSKKIKSLPRFELCAAHLLSKLWINVKPQLAKYNIKGVFLWSDSEIVLHWIKSHPSSLNTFVSNRVAEIQENTSDAVWRYVPSAHNPADIVSRGCNVENIKNSIWFSGPDFLKLSSDHWPTNTHINLSPEQILLEKKKSKIALVVTELPSDNSILNLIDNCSSYRKVIRVVAYMLRFVRGVRGKNNVQNLILTASELEFSFLKVISTVQHFEFYDDIQKLEKSLPTNHQHIQRLNPFIQNSETDGIKLILLRVGGRLSKAPIDYGERFPLLMSKDSRFIKLYFEHLHRTNCHAGPKALIGISREKIWVVNARQLVRKIVNSCVLCYRFKPKLCSQIMGDLPRDRLSSCRPFLICGVDLCGPVLTTLRIRGRPPVKTYVAVFVCFSSKAVHLEALSDLQTDTFLSTLNRFVGRRGLPKKIWCDNATNFVGTARVWSEKGRIQVQQASAEKGVEFQFIPPRAPHFGGLWEAAVKSAKYLMLRTIGNAGLTFEELTTVLVDVEAVLNSRPIVVMTEDPNDEVALTPGHLLIGCSLKALPGIDAFDNKAGSLKRYRILCSLKEHFWDVWRRDYLRELQGRGKWTQASANIKVGDVVVIHEDNLPPQKWLTGKVESVIVGSDDKVRVADVRTAEGKYRRPIHKLAILPIDNCNTDDSFAKRAMLLQTK